MERNFEIFRHQINGENVVDERIDICWFCGHLFTETQATYCETCLTYKCPEPSCGKCFCDLPPMAQQVLEREMLSLGLWHLNPKRRKKRKKYLDFESKSHFLEWCKLAYPSYYESYSRGAVTFDELVNRLRVKMDRGILIR